VIEGRIVGHSSRDAASALEKQELRGLLPERRVRMTGDHE
jgi:hypothetical protein